MLPSNSPGTLRLAELVGALSLATDVGMGQPPEQALRTCLIAVRLGERLGLPPEGLAEVYYVALLRFLGCTADAPETAALVGGDEMAFRAAVAPVLGGSRAQFLAGVVPSIGRGRGALQRARAVGTFIAGSGQIRQGVRGHCELAENLASRLGLGPGVRLGIAHALERWDGDGLPDGLAGERIALSARIVFLARDADVLSRLTDSCGLSALIRRRRGKAYDPLVTDVFLKHGAAILAEVAAQDAWVAVLDAEPHPTVRLPEGQLDGALETFADFADLKSTYTLGHSRGVARLVGDAARRRGPDDSTVTTLHRAALVHDLGRVAVPAGVWAKPGALSTNEWELVRLHAYHGERILARSGALAPLAEPAGRHHERADGSGYHRGTRELSPEVQLLAAADAFQAMTQPRPQRPALTAEAAAAELRRLVTAGKLGAEVVDAVLSAAGEAGEPGEAREPGRQSQANRVRTGTAPRRTTYPAALTEREVEVLRLIARGETKARVAAQLSISPSTADHHVRHIYEKIGVSTRAGAAVFALQHHLLS